MYGKIDLYRDDDKSRYNKSEGTICTIHDSRLGVEDIQWIYAQCSGGSIVVARIHLNEQIRNFEPGFYLVLGFRFQTEQSFINLIQAVENELAFTQKALGTPDENVQGWIEFKVVDGKHANKTTKLQ